jgi:hypothetical protein
MLAHVFEFADALFQALEAFEDIGCHRSVLL